MAAESEARRESAPDDHALQAEMARLQQRNAELERRLAELEALWRVLPVGIGIAEDAECRRIRTNPAFAKMLRLSEGANASLSAPDTERPSTFRILHQGVEMKPEDLPMQTAARQGREVRELELDIVHNDGAVTKLLEYAEPLYDEQGKVRGSLGVFVDITDKHRLEEQLHQAQKMESIGRLAGGVAHDFNNLLTAILGYTDLAATEIPMHLPAYGYLQNVRTAGARATSLTRQLLAFARKQIIEPRVLRLNELIIDVGRLLRRLIGEHIELVTLPASDLWSVRVDPGQMEQVLINLAVNARDAMPHGGKIIIETRNVLLEGGYARQHSEVLPGNYVLLAVSDTGTGIAPDIQGHIFEPFFTTKERGKGTGLGLATCYGIVHQSGGHIWVYSEPGEGASFKIYLPRVDDDSAPTLVRETARALPGGSETILLVEDEELVRAIAVQTLRARGYHVIEASNGSEALHLAQEVGGEIHLLITDVVMPQMGGKELAQRLQALRPTLKILFTSGYTDNAIIHQGRLDPGIEFLSKPFMPAALINKTRAILDRPLP